MNISAKITLLNNKEAKIEIENDIDDEFKYKIKKLLSYTITGVRYNPNFRAGNWDGTVYLINGKGIFPIGLINKVQNLCKDNFVSISIVDNRLPIKIEPQIDLTEAFKKLGITPRDYQDDASEKAYQIINGSRNGIISACTSSGKTLIAAKAVAKFNKPTIIYTIGLDICSQFFNLFSSLFEEKIGFIGDGIVDIQRINVATLQTIGRALDIKIKDLLDGDDEIAEEKFNESDKAKIIDCLKRTEVHILDEAHCAGTSTVRSIHRVIDGIFIGLSGTPFKNEESDLLTEGLLGNKIVDISATSLIEKGVIVQPIIKFQKVPTIRGLGNNYQSVYKKFVVENDYRNNLIVKDTKQLVNQKYKTLVLFKQIKHGNILAEEFKKANIKFALLSGKDSLKDRNEVKRQLTDGEIDVVLASTIFDIGVDLPALSGLILCGSGKSYVRALQRIGRVIRPYPGKKRAAIIDYYDDVKFLRDHSKKRKEIYLSEPGFKVIDS